MAEHRFARRFSGWLRREEGRATSFLTVETVVVKLKLAHLPWNEPSMSDGQVSGWTRHQEQGIGFNSSLQVRRSLSKFLVAHPPDSNGRPTGRMAPSTRATTKVNACIGRAHFPLPVHVR
jgi:hypothetical protein